MPERCDACGQEVRLAGGIANIWTTEQTRTEGMTLEFEDGSEHFLCFDCIEQLPDEPTAADIEELTADGSESDAE
jgi:hypothetical protein